MLNLEKKCVAIVGGGTVALRRTRTFLACGAVVRVVAPAVHDEIRQMHEAGRIAWEPRAFQPADAAAFLTCAATDDPSINEAVGRAARAAGSLLLRADDADLGDLAVPAHRHLGPITVAIATGGASAQRAAALCDAACEAIPSQLPELLEAVKPWRSWLRRHVTDAEQRRVTLGLMAGDDALSILRTQGRAALDDHLTLIAERATDSPCAS